MPDSHWGVIRVACLSLIPLIARSCSLPTPSLPPPPPSHPSGKAKKAQKGKSRPRLEGSVLFSLDELLDATHNFHPSTLLGRGGFGHVYQGTLPGTQEAVAIKVLNRADLGGPVGGANMAATGSGEAAGGGAAAAGAASGAVSMTQGEKEYEAEVKLLTTVRHRNLVRLVGFCCDAGERMLVYEFMPRGSLAQHLHGEGGPAVNTSCLQAVY